jgi:hypothetical protein
MGHVLEPFAGLDAVQALLQRDPLFPLGRGWVADFLEDKVELRPRDVLNWAREGWRRQQELLSQQGGPDWLAQWGVNRATGRIYPQLSPEQIQRAIDEKAAETIAEQKSQRLAEPYTLSPLADNLAGLIFALLEQYIRASGTEPTLEVKRMIQVRGGTRSPYDLLLVRRDGDGKETRLGLTFITTDSGQSTTGSLKRLVHDFDPADRIFLVTDERQPLRLAAKGQEYFDRLRQRGGERFQHIELTFDEYAELDALAATVNLARSGDLEIELSGGESKRVEGDEIIAAHQRQRRYQSAAVLREVLATQAREEAPTGSALDDRI